MFTFSNQTPDTLSWQVSVDQPWVDLSTTSGVMSAGASDSVVVSPNSNAGLLPLGFYSAVLTVSDITHTSDVTRAVYLQVGNGYTLCSEPYLWTEPSSETALSFTGGVSATIIMPFDFSFYGQIYSNFHVTSHGLIGFGDPADLGSATPLPLGVMSPPYAILSPLWSDIDAAAIPGAVTWGVSGSTPDRQLIVRWSNARSSTEPTATNTFQVVLSEAASLLVDNEIVFQYRDVAQDAPLTGGGRAATIGLQDQIGQFRTEYSSAGSSLLADAMGMRFTMQPPADTNAPVPAVRFLTENGSTLTFEVRFNEIVAGTLTTNDFDLGGTLSSVTAVANVSGNGIYGLRYIVTASTAVGDYGSVSLAVRAGVLADLNGNLNLASAPCLHVRPFRAVAFRDDMELGSFNWTTSGSNIFSQIISDVWRWGIPSNGPPSACSPTHCWGTGMTGKCPDNAWATLQSPQIPVGDSPVLKDAVWYNFLNGSGFVEVFDGSAWINVTPGGVYNAVSGGWLAESVTLDSAQFGNRNLRVRFRVLTPASVTVLELSLIHI